MKRMSILAASLVTLVLIGSSTLKAGENSQAPCYSMKEAKSRGCYVCTVVFTPQAIDWKNYQIVIEEAWIERRTERIPTMIPFAHRYKIIPGYNLCFTLSKGWDVLGLWDITHNHRFFVLEGKRAAFGPEGTWVLHTFLDSVDTTEFTIICTDNWQLDDAIQIKAIPDRQSASDTTTNTPKTPRGN